MLASKVNRIRLISWVTLFFVSNLPIFYFLGKSSLLAWKVRDYAGVNLVLVLVWLWVAWAVNREHKKLVPNENTEPARKAMRPPLPLIKRP
jgi:hypothetical protein